MCVLGHAPISERLPNMPRPLAGMDGWATMKHASPKMPDGTRDGWMDGWVSQCLDVTRRTLILNKLSLLHFLRASDVDGHWTPRRHIAVGFVAGLSGVRCCSGSAPGSGESRGAAHPARRNTPGQLFTAQPAVPAAGSRRRWPGPAPPAAPGWPTVRTPCRTGPGPPGACRCPAR